MGLTNTTEYETIVGTLGTIVFRKTGNEERIVANLDIDEVSEDNNEISMGSTRVVLFDDIAQKVIKLCKAGVIGTGTPMTFKNARLQYNSYKNKKGEEVSREQYVANKATAKKLPEGELHVPIDMSKCDLTRADNQSIMGEGSGINAMNVANMPF